MHELKHFNNIYEVSCISELLCLRPVDDSLCPPQRSTDYNHSVERSIVRPFSPCRESEQQQGWMSGWWSVVFCFVLKLSLRAEKLLAYFMKKKSFRVVNQDPDINGQQLLELEVISAKDLLTKPRNSQFLYHLNLYVSVRLRAGMGCSGSPERWSKRGKLGVKLYTLSTKDRFIGTFWAIGTKCFLFYSEIIVCQILLSGLCSILFWGGLQRK